MRLLVIVGLGAALVSIAAGSAPAALRGNPDARTLALNTAKVDLSAAITYESRAEQMFKADKAAAAKKDLAEAIDALDSMENAAKELTSPLDLNQAVGKTKEPDPWAIFNTRRLLAAQEDERAISAPSYEIVTALGLAGRLKEDLLHAVTNELAHPDCLLVTNLQGPPTVNGVAMGHSELTVDFSCKEKIASIYVDVPANVIDQVAGVGNETPTVEGGGHILKIDTNGATSGQATMETSPDASPGAPLQTDVIPIAGDSVEYFIDVM